MPFDLSENFITAAEHALGAALPDEYKVAILRSNGGELEIDQDHWNLYPIADTSDRKRLARTANHILVETQVCQGWSNFPGNALAIAGNGSGDQLVLLKSGLTFSSTVYAWSHETGALTVVAERFDQLQA